MKIKMWCLINKEKNHIIKIEIGSKTFVVGFETRKGLLEHIRPVNDDEEIKKIEVNV